MGLWADSHSADWLLPWPWARAELVVFTVDIIPAHIAAFNMFRTIWVPWWVHTFDSHINASLFKTDPLLVVASEFFLELTNVNFGVPHLLFGVLTAWEVLFALNLGCPCFFKVCLSLG